MIWMIKIQKVNQCDDKVDHFSLNKVKWSDAMQASRFYCCSLLSDSLVTSSCFVQILPWTTPWLFLYPFQNILFHFRPIDSPHLVFGKMVDSFYLELDGKILTLFIRPVQWDGSSFKLKSKIVKLFGAGIKVNNANGMEQAKNVERNDF